MAFKKNRPELANVVFHNDNVRQKLRKLRYERLRHLLYNPDLTSSKYKLVRLLQNFLTLKDVRIVCHDS